MCTLLSMTGTTCLQQFSVSPSSLLVFPGTNVTMVCRVYNILGQCRWEKDGKPVGMYPDKYTLPSVSIVGTPGDCSLYIARVDLGIDEGLWKCQVTASNISSQDALVSPPARLTVQGN